MIGAKRETTDEARSGRKSELIGCGIRIRLLNGNTDTLNFIAFVTARRGGFIDRPRAVIISALSMIFRDTRSRAPLRAINTIRVDTGRD